MVPDCFDTGFITMHRMHQLKQYFPLLSEQQLDQYFQAFQLYSEWNSKINVISRKDIDQLTIHHFLHSLAIAAIVRFKPGTSILDAGTGGGFPGIPLAIFFPESRFTLVDSITKKIRVAEDITRRLGLQNVILINARFETLRSRFDFITGRAVTNIGAFTKMTAPLLKKTGFNEIPNGILYLTGGELQQDLEPIRAQKTGYDLSLIFEDPYFETKKLIHLYNFS